MSCKEAKDPCIKPAPSSWSKRPNPGLYQQQQREEWRERTRGTTPSSTTIIKEEISTSIDVCGRTT